MNGSQAYTFCGPAARSPYDKMRDGYRGGAGQSGPGSRRLYTEYTRWRCRIHLSWPSLPIQPRRRPAARDLRALGVSRERVSIVVRSHDEEGILAQTSGASPGSEIEDSRPASRLGELSGHLIAAVALVMPGIGPIVADGPLAAGLGEAAGHLGVGFGRRSRAPGLTTIRRCSGRPRSNGARFSWVRTWTASPWSRREAWRCAMGPRTSRSEPGRTRRAPRRSAIALHLIASAPFCSCDPRARRGQWAKAISSGDVHDSAANGTAGGGFGSSVRPPG